MNAEFKIKGLKELSKELKALPKDFRDKSLNGATSKAAATIRDEAKALVVKDEGRLRDAIFSGILPKARRYSQWVSQYRVDVRTRGKKGVSYGHMIEFGSVKNQTPDPFMRPAFDNKAMFAVAQFKKVLDKKVKFYQRKVNRLRAK